MKWFDDDVVGAVFAAVVGRVVGRVVVVVDVVDWGRKGSECQWSIVIMMKLKIIMRF